jgi:hypothetical protein
VSFLPVGKGAPALRSELIRAARALLRWEQRDLANASSVSLPTKRALEAAGIEFIDENGGGPGVRLRKRQKKKD